MPPHLFCELASQPKSRNLPTVCYNRFGLGMTKTLPLEQNRSPPASKLDNTAMLLGRVANLAMRWVKKWFHLWGAFSGALMKAIWRGIAKGACRLAAAAPLEKARRSLGEKEELGRGESKIDGAEKLSRKADYQKYLLLNRLEGWSQEDVESLIEDGPFGEYPRPFFSGAKLDKMDLEDNAALCLIRHSISFNFENGSESSSDEDVGLGGVELPGSSPQNSLVSLSIGGYFEDSCNPQKEFGVFEDDIEGDSWQSTESPSVSEECRESFEPNEDFVVFEGPSMESTSDSSEDGEHLSQCGKEASKNLGTPAVSYGFKSPLVLSLFYSPTEEDNDDDSEDWSSEDEIEETNLLSLDGAVSDNKDHSSAAEDNSPGQGVPENLCGSSFTNMDPLRSLCVSKSVQPATCAPPQPEKHQEITVSFYRRKPDSKLEEFCNPPEPSSPNDQRSATGHPLHQRCQLETENNLELVTTETSSGSQKESRMVKKVRFFPEVTVHTLVVWDYASRAARRGPWEEMARDRCRFRRRIAEVGAILEPCLAKEHRANAWKKIHGPCLAGKH